MSSLGNKQIMANNIKFYMRKAEKTQKEICKDLGIAETTFSGWVRAVTYPRIDKIELMANYFGIEKSDLVEDKQSSTPTLNNRDERDIQKRLESIMNDLNSDDTIALYNGGQPMDEQTKELMRASIENALRISKLAAKEKYTPKKYKK
jgi:transcriptional regulator with XRE-family HTH domain